MTDYSSPSEAVSHEIVAGDSRARGQFLRSGTFFESPSLRWATPPLPAAQDRGPDLAALVDGVEALIENDPALVAGPADDGVAGGGVVELVRVDGVVSLVAVQGLAASHAVYLVVALEAGFAVLLRAATGQGVGPRVPTHSKPAQEVLLSASTIPPARASIPAATTTTNTARRISLPFLQEHGNSSRRTGRQQRS